MFLFSVVEITIPLFNSKNRSIKKLWLFIILTVVLPPMISSKDGKQPEMLRRTFLNLFGLTETPTSFESQYLRCKQSMHTRSEGKKSHRRLSQNFDWQAKLTNYRLRILCL